LLRELRHDNIVRYYDRVIDKTRSTLYIIMEYCEAGDLASYIRKMKTSRCVLADFLLTLNCVEFVCSFMAHRHLLRVFTV